MGVLPCRPESTGSDHPMDGSICECQAVGREDSR